MAYRILLCADGSTFSDSAAHVAIGITKAQPGAALTALHVTNVVEDTSAVGAIAGALGFAPAAASEEVVKKHIAKGDAVLEEIVGWAGAAGVSVETKNEQGMVAKAIASNARHTDLVVMGLRGSVEDTFPGQGGGHIGQILDRIAEPILLVGRDHREITSIAIGYDGSDSAARSLRSAAMLATAMNLTLHAIYVSKDGTGGEVLDEIAELFPEVALERHVVAGDTPHEAIADAAKKAGANLLAVGFRGRSKVKDFLFGTASDYILTKTDLMVLVAH